MPIAPNGVRPDNAPAFASAPPPLTRAELVEVYEIWKLLGPMATARAAAIATREQVLEAVELVALMRTEPVGTRWADYNMAFHGLIEDFGSGPRLGAILAELRGLASGFVRQSILASADQRLDEANSEHEEILRAVIAGDAEGAAEAALRHLDSSLRGLLTVREVRACLSVTSPWRFRSCPVPACRPPCMRPTAVVPHTSSPGDVFAERYLGRRPHLL